MQRSKPIRITRSPQQTYWRPKIGECPLRYKIENYTESANPQFDHKLETTALRLPQVMSIREVLHIISMSSLKENH